MNNFKLYLIEVLKKLNKEKELLEKKISEIPTENNIDITEYGNIKELSQEYHAKKKSNLIKRIIKPTKEELRKFIRTNLLSKQTKELDKLIIKINELKEIINSIENNQITSELPNTNLIIKELIKYSLNQNIESKETINLLLDIIRNTKKDDSIDYKVKHGLISFYNDDNTIIENSNINTLKMIYEKLFILTFTEEEKIKYTIIIDGIYIEILLNIKENKEKLIAQKKSLEELKKYLSNGEIKLTPENINEFKTILDRLELDNEIKEYLTNEIHKIEKEQVRKAEEEKTKRLLEKYLSEKELNYIIISKEIENNYTPEIKQLIIRLRNDIISMCKYIEMVEDSINLHETIEILAKRVELLKEVIENLTKHTKKHPKFHYLTDTDYVPFVLRSIETKDITELSQIHNLFRELNKKTTLSLPIRTINNIPIYKISNDSHAMLYSRKNNKIIIIDIYSNLLQGNKTPLTSSKISQLIEYFQIHHTKELEKLNLIYEDLIATSLNYNRHESIKEYKKER